MSDPDKEAKTREDGSERIALHYAKKCEALEERIEDLEAALVQIDSWAKAYPLDIFPKPDLQRAAIVLKAAGMTLDAISADTMRHVIDGVKDITEQALNK